MNIRLSMWANALAVLALIGGLAGVAHAAITSGAIYVDDDQDGVLSTGDTTVPGVAVFWEGQLGAISDAQGRYSFESPGAGIVWVRIPEGFSPSPVWATTKLDEDATIDLALVPAKATGDLTMIVAADTHMHTPYERWDPDALALSLAQATDMEPTPHFITIVGDITQANRPGEFVDVIAAMNAIETPFVPVVGNHDWYDGGAAYRENFGPDMYSFDAGGVHHVVLNAMAPEAKNDAFLRADLALSPPGMMVVAYTHGPPTNAYAAVLRDAGIDYLFTGHWHSNRVVDHGSMREFNTQNFIMGGLDFTPAGYRVVSVSGGELQLYHRTIVESPVISVSFPRTDDCVPSTGFEVYAAVQLGASTPRVVARIDGGEPIEMTADGGWTYRGTVGALSPTSRQVAIEVYRGEQLVGETSSEFRICRRLLRGAQIAPWPQLQGGGAHLGSTQNEIAPPLQTAWARHVGAHLQGGSPAVDAERVYVSLVDLGDASRGGVVAFDARSGRSVWRYTTGFAVRNAPAVASDTVVIADNNGTVYALEAATGALAWTYDLSEGYDEVVSAMYAAPTIADGVVYAGTQKHFAAIDLATGVAIWTSDPSPNAAWLGSYSAAGVGSGVAIGAFSRGVDGMVAWDAATGDELWRLPPPAGNAVNTSPVMSQQWAYFGPADSTLYAVDIFTGAIAWSTRLNEDGFNWGYELAATPALADETLYVGTQSGVFFALDATTGAVKWTFDAVDDAVVHPEHYRARTRAFGSSAAVTGKLVWVGGVDGRLSALDAITGQEVWHTTFAAPIMSGVVPAGDFLFVSTYDGMVHALVPSALFVPEAGESGTRAEPAARYLAVLPSPAKRPTLAPDSGCGCAAPDDAPSRGSLALILGLAWCIRRPRRRRPA